MTEPRGDEREEAPAQDAVERDGVLTWRERARRWLFGAPLALQDETFAHQLSLIPFLAWVGLGADGLSSSAYGPEESFKALGQHTYLAIGLAVATALTVFLISSCYSRIIEKFPHGGGGYVVATKLLGPRVGLVSGCALLVDYVLTVTVSVAAAGNALRDVLRQVMHFPESWVIPIDVLLIALLLVLNLRGVKESVVALVPVFLLFLVTHAALIIGGIVAHLGDAGTKVGELAEGFSGDFDSGSFGPWAMLLVFFRAFSLGGGTYTGIEAVSSSMGILREPRVQTAKTTMRYMAISLAFVASGLILSYLLWDIRPAPDGQKETMNSLLARAVTAELPGGRWLVFLTLLSEAVLLLVAAQAGFIAGPRTLANLAIDSWAPRRFSALSERLTTQNGVTLMAIASVVALLYAAGATPGEATSATSGHGGAHGGDVIGRLVTMYSINVFVTFTLSMLAMTLYWWRTSKEPELRQRRLALFATGTVICSSILLVTVCEKFTDGGWMTIVVTTLCVLACLVVRRHYVDVAKRLSALYSGLADISLPDQGVQSAPDPERPTAVVLVSNWGGLGIHTVLNVFRSFPDHFKNVVFVSVGVIDSGAFKGDHAVEGLENRTESMLGRYVDLARRLGVPSASRFAIGTDAVEAAEELCQRVAKEFPRSTFFAGKVIFREEGFLQRFLHNETAVALQKRLHFGGLTMVILPARVT
jgi:amino acid transporter